ncbi:glucose-1-phosphate thymidylyltransferase RfbA [Christiangramia marina]|uniref:glucose-1-phosphate thymidylyltransferase RfbA n=1 Tax=Christiangramia marina TaxID=409436 RepID=UPI003AA87FF4
MKGIILAGGSGTRLYPITKGVSKQLLNVYDKPMIYYPLSVLMLAGIREVLIITTPEDRSNFEKLLGDGNDLGMDFQYAVQESPDGLAQAFIIGEEFIDGDDVALILGDNIFYGHGFTSLLRKSVATVEQEQKAGVFGYYVNEPSRYGVAEFDAEGNVISVEEKPELPKSNYAIVGLYFFPNSVVEVAKNVKPSKRGELEITSVIQSYLEDQNLKMEIMHRGYAWLDTGTHESMLEAGNFIHTLEKRQGLKVACLEEIAYEKGYISKQDLAQLAKTLGKSSYGEYLLKRAGR